MAESNMKRIIKGFGCHAEKGKNDKTRWLNTKIGWQYYAQHSPQNIVDKLGLIEKEARSCSNWQYKEPVHEEKRMRINPEVAINLGKRGEQNREVYVERYIAKHDINMCNQWCVGANSKESIDLVYKNGDSYTLIELKVSGYEGKGTYTPPFALIEVIKNYYLAKKFNKNIKVKELAILSTKNFYAKFAKDKNSINKFLSDKEKLSSKIGKPINLYYLDIDESKLIENLKKDKSIPEISFKNWSKNKINTIKDWENTTKAEVTC